MFCFEHIRAFREDKCPRRRRYSSETISFHYCKLKIRRDKGLAFFHGIRRGRLSSLNNGRTLPGVTLTD
ncbi:hypothetical protein L484_025365 [Morus notabilis]|uniref:Uncharacterized protein n=1 Tax=Morus notabilis TaxID=981085 RepID=W9R263_9ROSA|nr:hypothetical protein L484_025365 [Morus notabilis]